MKATSGAEQIPGTIHKVARIRECDNHGLPVLSDLSPELGQVCRQVRRLTLCGASTEKQHAQNQPDAYSNQTVDDGRPQRFGTGHRVDDRRGDTWLPTRERGVVVPLRDLNEDGVTSAFVGIVLRKLPAETVGLGANHGCGGGVEVIPATEHTGGDGVFADVVGAAAERFCRHKLQEQTKQGRFLEGG